jgi:hypothetical protein
VVSEDKPNEIVRLEPAGRLPLHQESDRSCRSFAIGVERLTAPSRESWKQRGLNPEENFDAGFTKDPRHERSDCRRLGGRKLPVARGEETRND